jgi:hypothetical protein
VLQLVQPARAVRRLSGGRDDLEADSLWQLGRDRPGGERESRHGDRDYMGARCSRSTHGFAEQVGLPRVGIAADSRRHAPSARRYGGKSQDSKANTATATATPAPMAATLQ